MSGVREETSEYLIACVADLHLSSTPPVARSNEPNWLLAQERPLHQLRRIAEKYKVPIVYAGDIFNKWKETPELINWAIANVPKGYSIPGNHEMPYHNYKEMDKSAYMTLVRAGVLKNLIPMDPQHTPQKDCVLWGFPFGCADSPRSNPRLYDPDVPHIAIIHHYIWMDPKSPVKPKGDHVRAWGRRLTNYFAGVFGDNHTPFVRNDDYGRIVNCGAFICRTVLECLSHRPRVSLLRRDGGVKILHLRSEDRWVDSEQKPELEQAEHLINCVELVTSMPNNDLSFQENLMNALNVTNAPDRVRQLCLKCLEKRNDS